MVSGPISNMFCCTLTSDAMFEHKCVYCHTNLLHILLHNSHQSYLWFSSLPPAWEHNLYHFIQLALQFLSLPYTSKLWTKTFFWQIGNCEQMTFSQYKNENKTTQECCKFFFLHSHACRQWRQKELK